MDATKAAPPQLQRMADEFRDFLYDASGIYYPEVKRDRLVFHVAERMKAVGESEPKKYLERLRSTRGPGSELWEFFNQATVNETYFFREEAQFHVFRDKILPVLFDHKKKTGQGKLTIWSAACSSGEEPYSIAILLKEVFQGELTNTTIIGFDIDSNVIDMARKGEYSEYSVRHCTEEQKKKYFSVEEDRYKLVPYIKRMATFRVANFMEPVSMKALPRPDLILCRNVLIYFDKNSKSKVLNAFSSMMHESSYLFLSQTETLFGVEHPFKPVHFFKACGYQLKA